MSSDSSAGNDRFFTLIGAGSAVMNVVAFTAVGYIALESLAYGAIAGLFGGVGSGLFLPWFLRLSAAQNESDGDRSLSQAAGEAGGNALSGVVGLGLELGGVAMLAIGFALSEPSFVSGPLVAVAVALTVAVVASELMSK